MEPLAASRSPLQRAAEINEVLRIWASAFGCSTHQVTDVVARAGLPIEKLWNSINAATMREAR